MKVIRVLEKIYPPPPTHQAEILTPPTPLRPRAQVWLRVENLRPPKVGQMATPQEKDYHSSVQRPSFNDYPLPEPPSLLQSGREPPRQTARQSTLCSLPNGVISHKLRFFVSFFNMAVAVIILLLHLSLVVESADHLTCKDEDGHPVQWYAGYKLPRDSAVYPTKDSPRSPLVDQGLSFAYITSNSKGGWKLSGLSVADPFSAPGRTLAPLYDKETRESSNCGYIVYNDEHPDGNTSFTAGHTKGVVVFGKKQGFWLIHSVPKYPSSVETGEYGYPHTGQMYGQSFLCITLDTKQGIVDSIGEQLLVDRPYVFEQKITPSLAKMSPSLALAAQGKHQDVPPYYNVRMLRLSGDGHKLLNFAKSTKFGKDLYADLVAPFFKQGFAVETWPNGPGKMNSSCSHPPAIVENVDSIKFKGFFYPPVAFTTRHDHSKWAVSLKKNAPWVCIGDINRMNTQKKRAGGTNCFINEGLWKAFNTIIQTVEPCRKKS